VSTEIKKDYAVVSLTSDCQCYDCKKCNTGYIRYDGYGEKCDECSTELIPSIECFGCWSDSKESFYEALKDWRNKVGKDWDTVKIEGTGMGWTGASGTATKPFEKALEALTLRGDFRITAIWEGKTFTATRASHDEPTGGAKFVFTLIEGEN
jgi:hypothetical protein